MRRRARRSPLVASFTIFAAEDPVAAIGALPGGAACAGRGCGHARSTVTQALELLAPFHAELRPLLPALKPLWTHNDLHASNLLWSDAGDDARAVAVIDFGLADRTNAVHDLAHAIERNIVEWLDLVEDPGNGEGVRMHIDHLEAMLDGYEQVRPLSEEEAAALAPMTALCHAEFALTEADYFLGVLQSKEKARLASMDYLVGHARWFRGSGGQKLLDAIRRMGIETRTASSTAGGSRRLMHWAAITNYLAANWMEDAGFLTTLLGIWLTTRRKLICWPVVLVAEVLYMIVFFRVRLYSDALLQIVFMGFTLLWMVVLVARRARRRRGARNSSAITEYVGRISGGSGGKRASGVADGTDWGGAASPGCNADELQPGGKLVADAQAHGQLVALDCRGPGLHRRIYLQGPADPRRRSMHFLQAWP